MARIVRRDADIAFVDSLDAMSDRDLGTLVDPVDTEDADFRAKVHGALYMDVKNDVAAQLVRSPLLLAVAALTTGTRRGRVSTVFSYNYDDLLETYLRRLGLSVKTRCIPTQLARWCDVEVNHVHGFIPRKADATLDRHDLVLSEKSYRYRRAGIDEGWPAAIHHALRRHVALFVGLSGDDSSILDVIQRARSKRLEPYSGYWLMTERAFARNHEAILHLGMCPIELKDDEFPAFIFDVCEKAIAPT